MTTALFLLGAVLLGQSPHTKAFSVEPAASSLGYRIVHKLHGVRGLSKDAEARAVFLPDGSVRVMVRAQVSSFRSGDANRDEHMAEVMETGKFPFVTFKGVSRPVLPASYPGSADVEVEGELELHGQKRPLKVPLEVERVSPERLRVTGAFSISLDGYGVERPSLFFVKIDDRCDIDFDLTLKAERPE